MSRTATAPARTAAKKPAAKKPAARKPATKKRPPAAHPAAVAASWSVTGAVAYAAGVDAREVSWPVAAVVGHASVSFLAAAWEIAAGLF